MAFMMDYMGKGWTIGFPLFGLGMMLFWLVIFLIIAYLVYRDANTRGMNGLLWAILVLIPMVGILFLVIYIIVRKPADKRSCPVRRARWIS